MASRDEMIRRQRALADFGDFVLDHEDLDAILNEGCRLIAQALDTDLAKVIEIERDADRGFVRAGVGWREGIVGRERISLSERSSEAFAIKITEPVITNDLSKEDRFEFPTFLREHDVVALVNVPILLPGRRPWGVLQVDARVPRTFDHEDVEFLKTYAMVLGPVIDRLQTVAEREEARRQLGEREERLRRVLDGMGEGFRLLASDFTILEQNTEAARLAGRTLEAGVGRSNWEADPEIEEAAPGRLLKQSMSERVPVASEYKDGSDGAARWVELRTYPTEEGGLAAFWRDVTDRREAVEALRDSEHRYRALFERMDQAYAVVEVLKDPTGSWRDFRFIEANPAFLEHTEMSWPVGKTATELLGSPNPRLAQLYGQALDEGRPIRVEEQEATLGRTFDLNIFALDRSCNRVAVLFTDITARKQAEAALRESEERLGLAIEVGGLASWDWNLKSGEVAWNDRHYLLQGYAVGEVEPSFEAWLARVHPDDRDETLALVERARERHDVYSHDFRTLAPNGDVRWCSARGRFFYDEAGAPYRMIGVMEDVTERTQIQAKISESEARLAVAFESVPVGVAVVSAAGKALIANAEFSRFLPNGRMPAYDAERGWRWRAWTGDGLPLEPQQFPGARALRGERVVPGQEMLYTDDSGREIWTSVATAPIFGADGRVSGFVTSISDIDAHKRAEARQKLLLAELQHRVRNILAMVRSIVRRTTEGGESVEDVANHLEGRLSALARTQTLLTRGAGVGIDLELLVKDELLAQNAGELAVTVQGPSVELAPKAAEVLTLAIHELATNSVKYGALSGKSGAVRVSWSIEPRDAGPDWLRLTWEEDGVDAVAPEPRRSGFGSELIRRRVPYELKGRGALDLDDGGVRAEIMFPLVRGESILASDISADFFNERSDA